MVHLMLAAALLRPSIPNEFYAYLAKKDPSFRYEIKDVYKGEIEMVSQTWQGHEWKHSIILQQPSQIKTKGTAILYITGDGPFKGDYLDLSLITASTGMPTAMLFDIPNQPLFGKKEDDLIAHTFEQYLETKDPNWPLLFPMAKSAIRAMDVIEAVTRTSSNPIHNFVVTGASKRGWTTWFVGASRDKRVKGIAPMVIDNLNVAKQMQHQMDTWGFYSDEIKDYTNRGLQAKLSTPIGHRLAQIVDPYSYRGNIRVPTLIVKGANDPYWTVDALSQYWDDLREPKWVVTVPNAGHGLGNKLEAVESIGAFARSIAGDFQMPKQKWEIAEELGDPKSFKVSLHSDGPALKSVKVWVAESDTLDFRSSKYSSVGIVSVNEEKPGQTQAAVICPKSQSKNSAVFAEARYQVGPRQFSLCSLTKVFLKSQ